jgi:hypothetical protein
VELASSHVPFLSHPAAVAQLIRQAAAAAAERAEAPARP